MIKYNEDSEVTLHFNLAHPFIIARISSHLRKFIQKALTGLLNSQYLKDYIHLLPKRQKIPKETNENAAWKNFALDFVLPYFSDPRHDKPA